MKKFLEKFQEKDKIEHLKWSMIIFYFIGALRVCDYKGVIVITLAIGFFKELILDMFLGSMLKLKGKLFFIGQVDVWDLLFDFIGIVIAGLSVLIGYLIFK